ncbi:MAG: colanic acid exporter [Firmicutes bacterium ADurb.Bin456]|nr:MAG: colanic acid exporter [Firmicutes bacterium ADurb.Bin456]
MKNSLSYQAFFLIAAKAADALTLLVLGMILARVLTLEDYGTYRQVWLLYYTLIPLFTLGIATSVNYFVPGFEPGQQKTFIFQTYSGLFILGFFFAVFLYAGADFFGAWFNNPALGQVIKIFSLVPLLTMPTSYYHNLYICLKKAIVAAGILTSATLVRFIVIAVAVYTEPSLKNIFTALLIYYVLEFTILSFLIYRPFKAVPLDWKKQNIREQLKFTVPIGLSSVVGAFSRQIDKLIISGYFTAREFAIYANGAMELPLARILNAAVMSVLMPELVLLYNRGEYQKMLSLWHRSIRKVSLIILPVMVFLFIFAREFLVLLYSEKYLASAGIFQIYLLTLPVRVTTFGSVLLAAGLSRVIMYYSIYTVLISVVLNLVMIRLWGVWGAALATVAGVYIITFLQLGKICSVVNCTFKDVYPWKITLHILVVSLAAGLVPQAGKLMISNGFISLIVNGFAYLSLFGGLAVKTKLLTGKEMEQAINKVRSSLGCSGRSGQR